MKRSEALGIFGVMGGLLVLAGLVVLYAQGYRLDLKKGITETGLILVKSLPDGAQVYLNGELVAATDSSIPNLKEGNYTVRIEKDGHLIWEKEVPVAPRLVTSIKALLPPISSSLTAVTQAGAKAVTPAPSGTKAVFISQKKLYLIPLNSPFLGFLRTRVQEIDTEPEEGAFTSISSVAFSPTEDQVLVRTKSGSWLFSLGTANPQEVADVAKLLTTWETQRKAQRAEISQNLAIPDALEEIALAKATYWSPDERKFLYEKKVNGKREFWVANLSNPLPVGEKALIKIGETADASVRIFWLGDSRHFVSLEGSRVILLDMDGSNRREIFSGTLKERVALSSADSAQVMVLTSFSSSSANLYAISLR
ncbi:MAG: PEGA domain-containing protein [Patescibacteria group bacterium]